MYWLGSGLLSSWAVSSSFPFYDDTVPGCLEAGTAVDIVCVNLYPSMGGGCWPLLSSQIFDRRVCVVVPLCDGTD
jgi:hypothetical protein